MDFLDVLLRKLISTNYGPLQFLLRAIAELKADTKHILQIKSLSRLPHNIVKKSIVLILICAFFTL